MTRALLASILLFACAAAGAAQTAFQPPPTLDSLLQKLADADFPTREAAQKALDQLPYPQMPALIAAEARVGDPEVKSRLQQRIKSMEIEAAINPPPLTLKLDQQPLAKIAEALNKQLGITYFSAYDTGDLYTLDAQNQPLWEIIRGLRTQHPVVISPIGGSGPNFIGPAGPQQPILSLNAGTTRVEDWPPLQVKAGFVIIPSAIRQLVIVGGNGNAAPLPQQLPNVRRVTFQMQVIADPRIRIISYSSPIFTELVDQNGRNLVPKEQPSTPPLVLAWPVTLFNVAATVDSTGIQVDKIARMKGKLRATVIMDMKTAIIENAATPTAAPVNTPLGSYATQLVPPARAGAAQRSWIRFEKLAVGMDFQLAENQRPRVYFRSFNKDGKAFQSSAIAPTDVFIFNLINEFGADPTRVEILCPTKTAEVVLDVEFKDVPVR